VQKTPAFEVASIRQFSGGILYVCFFLFKGLPLPTLKQLKWLSIMAVLMFVSSNGLATLALRYIPSGLAALIAALYPLSVVLIEMVFYKNNKINWGTFIGLFLGIAGIALVFYDSAFHNHSDGYWFGILVSLIAMITWAVATIFIARKKTDMNPYYATGWQMLISSFIMFLIVLITGDSIPISSIPFQTWAALAYLVSAGSIFAFIAFIYSMKNLEPGIASLYAYINPIVAILVGSVIMNEKVTLNIIIGSVITLGGVYLVNRSLKALK
jgi:drug/metabolite transporter (DMT)-like permease